MLHGDNSWRWAGGKLRKLPSSRLLRIQTAPVLIVQAVASEVPKTLADREHTCPSCGLVLCRDVNAAINILNRAVGCQALNLSGNVRAVA